MIDSPMILSRRGLVAAGGLTAVALAAGKADAATQAAGPTDKEKANVALVNRFCQAWSGKNLDLDALVATYMTDDCIVRFMDSTMMATGKAATLDMFKSFCAGDLTYELKVLNTVAVGPIVANTRIDTTFISGKPPVAADIAGVFIVHDGKIKEWSDYFIR